MQTNISIQDLVKIVEIDESAITLLASIPSPDIGNLKKRQVRAVILGDFLAINAGINITVAINIVKHVVSKIDLNISDKLMPVLQILDYKAVILTSNKQVEPLFILDKHGSEIKELPKEPPVLVLTIVITHLFKAASV